MQLKNLASEIEVNTLPLALYLVPLALALLVGGLMIVHNVRSRNELTGRKIGALPATRTTPQSGMQLRSATVLAATFVATKGEIPNIDIEKLLKDWLNELQLGTISDDQLLSHVALVFHRVETEEAIFGTMSVELKQKLKSWLDDYLNRKEVQA